MNQNTDLPRLPPATVAAAAKRAARAVLTAERISSPTEISIQLVDDPTIAALNARWLGRNGPTDVLAFGDEPCEAVVWPDDRDVHVLGDVVVSLDTAARQAAEHGEVVLREVQRLVVHGVLHLLGYDDGSASERRQMHRRQEDILTSIDDK